MIDYFERRLGFARDEAPPLKFEKLHGHLQTLGLANDEIVPYFAALLSLPRAGQYEPSTLSPARQKEKALEAILEWLRINAIRQPFLFVIEDLHWMDPSTLELLALHVEIGLNDRIMTLLTFRPEFETPWKSKSHQTVMALNRLTKKQITALKISQIEVGNLEFVPCGRPELVSQERSAIVVKIEARDRIS